MTNSITKIPLILINGSLGSGKTTLVRRMLQSAEFAGSLVIENEFASVNIDREALADEHHDDIVEISGSCICCSTGEELEQALAAVVAKGWQRPVILEATGMANSVQLMQRLYLNPAFVEHFEIASAVLLVDATEASADALETELTAEMRLADIIIINKADLRPEGAAALAVAARKLNPQAQVAWTHQSQFDLAIVGQSPSGAEAAFAEVFPLLGGLKAETATYAVLELNGPLAPEAVKQALVPERFLGGVVLKRAKGFFCDDAGIYWHVEATAHHCEVKQSQHAKPGVMVAIGEGMTKAALKEVLGV